MKMQRLFSMCRNMFVFMLDETEFVNHRRSSSYLRRQELKDAST